mmetsp:Transcript_46747/g.144185  ORF Transcript_46747/g.144185 Transcript_46747/m.144185 type:complete len:351 (-) Transcript_46747:1556-2608(-)
MRMNGTAHCTERMPCDAVTRTRWWGEARGGPRWTHRTAGTARRSRSARAATAAARRWRRTRGGSRSVANPPGTRTGWGSQASRARSARATAAAVAAEGTFGTGQTMLSRQRRVAAAGQRWTRGQASDRSPSSLARRPAAGVGQPGTATAAAVAAAGGGSETSEQSAAIDSTPPRGQASGTAAADAARRRAPRARKRPETCLKVNRRPTTRGAARPAGNVVSYPRATADGRRRGCPRHPSASRRLATVAASGFETLGRRHRAGSAAFAGTMPVVVAAAAAGAVATIAPGRGPSVAARTSATASADFPPPRSASPPRTAAGRAAAADAAVAAAAAAGSWRSARVGVPSRSGR